MAPIVSSPLLTVCLAVPKNRNYVLHCIAKRLSKKEARRMPRSENIPGEFFVDRTCIDCDTCRFMSPTVFKRVGKQSAVVKQPENEAERIASLQALISCPTQSIHVESTARGELQDIEEMFPLPVTGCDGIYFCGFTDEKSFAASSYLIKGKTANVLVDCPRFHPALVYGFDSLGGVDVIFLTHIDDVGDHAKWAKHYDIPRVIHESDVNEDTKKCEMQLEGDGPWGLGEEEDADEFEIIHTPGHTPGSICLFHKPSKTMFTGDHFLYSEKNGGFSMLDACNKYDLSIQLENVLKLREYDFLTLIPGHQRRYLFESFEEKNRAIQEFVDTYRKQTA